MKRGEERRKRANQRQRACRTCGFRRPAGVKCSLAADFGPPRPGACRLQFDYGAGRCADDHRRGIVLPARRLPRRSVAAGAARGHHTCARGPCPTGVAEVSGGRRRAGNPADAARAGGGDRDAGVWREPFAQRREGLAASGWARTWDEIKDEFADRCIAEIARYAPNVPSSIVHRQIVTPLDLERTFGLTGGNIFQGAMPLHQLFARCPAGVTTGRRFAGSTSAAARPTRAAASWGPAGGMRHGRFCGTGRMDCKPLTPRPAKLVRWLLRSFS